MPRRTAPSVRRWSLRLAIALCPLAALGAASCAPPSALQPLRTWARSSNGLSRRRPRPAPTRVPIVMYHAVQAPPANAPYPGLFLRPALFASQMRFLARHRFHPITLDRLYAAWHGGASLPSKPIVLTFDDGFRSVYRFAVPVLRAHRWPAVLDLAVAHLHEGTWGLNRPEVMTMIRKGWELDSHTLTHQNLTALADAALRRETLGSRRLLRRLFGVPVRFLCYPAGEYDQRVIDAARAAGYIGGTTELPGGATRGEWFTLPRIRAPDGGGDALAQALAGALGPVTTWR